MATPSNLFRICSLLMSCLFAYSASVQLNDPDWYFWFPLYAFACAVNLLNWMVSPKASIVYAAKLALWLGIFLFIKVVIEDFVSGRAGFCSLDLTERLVREKIGSALVVISMILHLKASSSSEPRHPKQRKNNNEKFARSIDIGMAVLVGVSYGLPFVFFVIQKREIQL